MATSITQCPRNARSSNRALDPLAAIELPKIVQLGMLALAAEQDDAVSR
jgi:hypothetical protein